MKQTLIIISYQHYTLTPITLSDLIILSQNVCLSVPIYQISVAVVGVKNAGMIILTFLVLVILDARTHSLPRNVTHHL